jgi:hypothetical protein
VFDAIRAGSDMTDLWSTRDRVQRRHALRSTWFGKV